MPSIAVTGSSGAVGGAVARLLADRSPRLVVRDPARAPSIPGTEVAVASYADPDAARRALAGIEVLFMVSAAESATRRTEHRAFIEAAASAGVGHLVYTSFAGAAPDATFTLGRDHWDAESAIRASSMRFTLLRDNFYLDVLPLFADETGAIRGPAGSGRVAAVARADVAEVAAAVLRSPHEHRDTTYELTGPEALRLDEVATRAGSVLGRDLRYVEETVEEAYASRRAAYDAEQWQLDAWVSTYTAIADGSVARVTDDVERLLRQPARTLEAALGPV
ncbi:NAD(P)H-binding protein [Nocardioides sp. JQ2195]|uniref:NAD(P)H-binding protein n=1 Tax=Nocardioides sp. JQ2195 TaxID=2592334 RepID=UPI00143E1A80|nr:NAD(P)H-binding protein [Nocardioides sp. JQ2195]QIX28133.1 NAD(P)H-binding protein [Nocardioides sp. JQ2195]